MIKGILFDIHGTIIDKGGKMALDSALKNAHAFINKNGRPLTFDEYYKAWLNNLRKHRKDMEELNEVGYYDWYDGILSDLGLDDYDEEFMNKLDDQFAEGFRTTTTAMPDAKLVLTELKKEFMVAAVSNSMARSTYRDLSIVGLTNLMDGIYISSEIGKRKPHPHIFNEALSGLSIRPEQAVFVGDDLFEDIFGAKQVGMKTIFINRGDPLKDFTKEEVFQKLIRGKETIKGPEEIEPDFIVEDLKTVLESISALNQ
ncbi:MAG: HAD family hydrolase [Thermodesulfobacteriota bacterium]|nr:HAD family hydrolase [Thermodesulfobacteriota bacterium]